MKGIVRQSDRARLRRQQMAGVMAALEADLVARKQILPSQSPPVAVAPGDPRSRPASPPAMEAGGTDQARTR